MPHTNWSSFARGKFQEDPSVPHGFFLRTHETVGEAIPERIYVDHYIRVWRYATPRGRIIGYRIEPKVPRELRSTYSDYYATIFTSDKPRPNKQGKTVVKEQLFWLLTFKSGRYTNYLAIGRIREAEEPTEEDEL